MSPNDKLYEGMIIGIHSRDNALVVNPIKGKQLTNVRSNEALAGRTTYATSAEIA